MPSSPCVPCRKYHRNRRCTLKKKLFKDWKARVLFKINLKTGLKDNKGKWRTSPVYTWVKELFSNPSNDENLAQLAERLSAKNMINALLVCHQALFSFPPRKFPWNNLAAVNKARKNAAELAAFLREWKKSQLTMRWVVDAAEWLEDLAAFFDKAGNPIKQLTDGRFEFDGIITPKKPGRGRRPVDPLERNKGGRVTTSHWLSVIMLENFFRERFGPHRPKRMETALLLSTIYPYKYSVEQVKRTIRTIKAAKAVPTPMPTYWD